jgi:hypothetical protein
MYSWVPATFSGQGGADLFDANMQPKPAYTALQALLGGTSTSSVSPTSSTSTISSTTTPPPSSTASSTTSTQTYTGTLPIYPESPTGLATLAKAYGKYIGSAYDYPYVSDKNYTDIVLANVDQFTCENSMKVCIPSIVGMHVDNSISGIALSRRKATSLPHFMPIRWYR